MRTALLTGLTAAVTAAAIAAAIAAPAAHAAQQAPAPTIQAGQCTVRHSGENKGFTFASCLVSVNNAPNGKIKLNYKSNLATYNPHAEFGPWNTTTGKLTIANGETVGVMFAFPHKTVAQVKKNWKLTVSNATPGLNMKAAVATA